MAQKTPLSVTALLCVGSFATPVLAQQYTTQWDGDTSTNMNAAANWDNGGIGREAVAVFDNPSAVTFQPDIPTGAPNDRAEVNALVFNQAGWNITTDGTTHLALWNQGGTPYIISNGAGTNTVGGMRTASNVDTVTTGTGNTLEIGYSNGALTFGTKLGAGTLILGAGALLNDIPDVNAGTLIVNSTSARNGASTKTIVDGAVLGGAGGLGHIRNSPVYAFASGSTLAPGFEGLGDSSAGTLTFYTADGTGPTPNFNINLQSNSTLAIDIFADGSSDKVLLTGTKANSSTSFTIDSNVTLALFGTPAATTYTIAEFTEAGRYTSSDGTFSTITLNGNPLTEGVDYTIAYNEHASFDAGTGSIQVSLINIPEPQTYAILAGFCALGLAVMRRRL